MMICSYCVNAIEKCNMCDRSFKEGHSIYCDNGIRANHYHTGCYKSTPLPLAEVI